MAKKQEPLPGTNIKGWRSWCAQTFAQLIETGTPKVGPTLADEAAKLFPLSLAGALVREAVGREANRHLNRNHGRAVTPKSEHKTWEQMPFEEFTVWVREQQVRVGALERSLVSQIESWLKAHPEVQLSVSDVLSKADSME